MGGSSLSRGSSGRNGSGLGAFLSTKVNKIRTYMDIQFPPFLQKGDKVVIVSPSSKIDQQFLKGAKKRMESWGLKVAIGKHAGSSSGRYAGSECRQ